MRNKIHDIILKVAQQNNKCPNHIEQNMNLRENLNMSSMDLAQMIAELDIALGVEPLAIIRNPKLETVKDITDLYEKTFQTQ